MYRRPLLILCCICSAVALRADEPATFVTHEVRDVAAVPESANHSYLLLSPAAIQEGERYPLVVYLHGAGAKGLGTMSPAGEPLPQRLLELREQHPCFVLLPQCRDGNIADGRPHNWVQWAGQQDRPPAEWIKSDEQPSEQLRGAMAALDDVLTRQPVDVDRVYLAGVSMGGSGAWYWAAQQPERFAAVVSVCGLSEATKAERLQTLPVRVFHGSDDATAPAQRSRDMAAALRAIGAPVQYDEYAGAGHNIAGQVAANDELWQWLFEQRRMRAANAAVARSSAADLAFFEQKVRPVFIEHCFKCHGPEKQQGNLRLDSRAAALRGGDYGPAIIPGDVAESWLTRGVTYKDDTLQMPPSGKLPDAVVRDLTEWVRRGAAWPTDSSEPEPALVESGEMVFTPEHLAHWAFQPVIPADELKRETAVDIADVAAFIDRQWLGATLDRPMESADPATLLRRITFDLTGLPPTPEEVAAFVADPSPEAYANTVDRLLASPHYGEHWGRHWLDVARYADSNGSEVDHAMSNAWRYRDYVVRSFNADKPFDRFVHEQLAGDLLPAESDAQAEADRITALGFLMLGPKALADLDKDRLLADIIDEQVDTVGRAFLGLTMGCCRCHDHKFDPLPTADYYALAGIFRSTKTMDLTHRVATWVERPVGDAADLARVQGLMAKIADLRTRRDAAGSANVAKSRPKLAAGQAYLLLEAEDFSKGNVRVDTTSLGKGIGVTRTLMEYPDHIEYEFDLPAAGDYQIELRYAAMESRPTQLILNGNLEEMEAAGEVTGGDWTSKSQKWFVQGVYRMRAGKNVLALHREGPVPMFDQLLIGLPSEVPHSKALDRKTSKAASAPATMTKQELDAAIDAARQELEAIRTAMAPQEGRIADAPILARGNPAMPGEIVPRGFPRIITGVTCELPGADQSGRRELAEWIVRPEHPLTSRVIVNRIWQWHFGTGLVGSPDNFGLRGETPTHPALLDGLAAWFVENGWSIKDLHRAICLSATYRAAPAAPGSPTGFPRRRLTAEELRDAMLFVSGALDPTVGGSLMTILNRTYANGGDAPADIAKQLHYDTPRRSLYLPIVRNALHDFFAVFDYPEPGMLTGQRSTTTVPPQALFLMNSPFVKRKAAAFAKRVQTLGSDDAGRIQAAYQLAFARPATNIEVSAAIEFLNADSELLAAASGAARSTAWTRLCHALLASNEFLYVH